MSGKATEERARDAGLEACGPRSCPFCRPATWRFLLPGLAIALLDQGAKWLVVRHMGLGDSLPVLGPVMSLTRASNTGAFFSLFSSATAILTAVGVVLALAVIVWGCRAATRQPELVPALALILGGALGNLADRLTRGHVVDFLDFHFWPVFNVADIALTVGVFLAAWRLLRTVPTAVPTESR